VSRKSLLSIGPAGTCRLAPAPLFWRPHPTRSAFFKTLLTVSVSAALLVACRPNTSGAAGDQGSDNSSASSSPLPPRPEKIWLDFDGEKALASTKAIADFGPRPAASESNAKTRKFLMDQLSGYGWQPLEQRFRENAPDGKVIEFCNVSARFSRFPLSTRHFVLGSHFDTVNTEVYQSISASDGAAGSAILLEIARVLATDPQLAARVELLFLDGNAPFRQLNSNDGLFGSRFYTQMLRISQHLSDIRSCLILENLGSAQFRLNYSLNSDKRLVAEIRAAAQFLGTQVEVANRSSMQDHVPFQLSGIPTLALLEADAPQLNTADDIASRLGSDSLARTGKVILYFLTREELEP
jgi:glutaminyl-peptide cyclotransferase